MPLFSGIDEVRRSDVSTEPDRVRQIAPVTDTGTDHVDSLRDDESKLHDFTTFGLADAGGDLLRLYRWLSTDRLGQSSVDTRPFGTRVDPGVTAYGVVVTVELDVFDVPDDRSVLVAHI